jgi:inosine/xanthosine triphosphate pyrophosphatase family protein
MAYANKTIDNDHLLKILATLETREAYFELGAAYADVSGQLHEFSYQVPIIMSEQARGNDTLRWERLMMFPGSTKTFAEFDASDRLEVWTKNYEAIADVITQAQQST